MLRLVVHLKGTKRTLNVTIVEETISPVNVTGIRREETLVQPLPKLNP